jgi:glycosyltransferase involved in cell wall biosynthesis
MLLLAQELAEDHDVTVIASSVAESLLHRVRWVRLHHRLGLVYSLARLRRAVGGALEELSRQREHFDVLHATFPLKPPPGLADQFVITWHFCSPDAWRRWCSGAMRYPGRAVRTRVFYNALWPLKLALDALTQRIEVRPPQEEGEAWVGVSKGLVRALREFYPWAHRIEVIPNAIHPRFFDARADERRQIRARFGVGDEDFLVLHVAHGHWARKGTFLLIDAIRYCEDRVKLMIVGGARNKDLVAEAQRLGIAHRLILPGSAADTRPFYAGADAFVFPSHYECQPLAPLEAAAAGLPVVATPTYGIEEWLVDGETGLVTRHDPRAIAEAIATLQSEPEMRRRLGAAAKAAAGKYRVDRMVEAYVGLYTSRTRDQRALPSRRVDTHWMGR